MRRRVAAPPWRPESGRYRSRNASQGVFEADAVLVSAAAVGFDGVCSREGGGAEQAAAEAGAFFVGPIDHANR